MLEFVQHVINGLSLGSIYALVAIGYTMVFGILRLINFAHGEVYMLGAFAGFYVVRWMGFAQNPSLAALLITLVAAMAFCAAAGFCIERLAYKPLRGAPTINVLITAVGVSLFLQYTGQLVFGSDPQFFPPVYQPQAAWEWGELKVNPIQVAILIISTVLMGILQFVLFRTRVGRAMRAVQFNHDLARLMGISTDKIISYTFMFGSALAGAAGVLVGLAYPKIDPLMGVLPGLKSFAAAVLGGIGNVTGAFLGAILLGLAEEFLAAYWSPTYRDALAFAILILILLIKPTGLLGKKQTEKV